MQYDLYSYPLAVRVVVPTGGGCRVKLQARDSGYE